MKELFHYIQMGAEHIIAWDGYDHLMFVASLIIAYTWSQWRKLLILLTAFTIGHAIAVLVIATNLFSLSESLVEFLIPLSILITAIIHMTKLANNHRLNYSLAVIFGLIHGSAFAQLWDSLFGLSADFLISSLGFNLGLELGQVLFALVLLGLMSLSTKLLGWQRDKVRLFIFAVIITLSCQLLWQNRLW